MASKSRDDPCGVLQLFPARVWGSAGDVRADGGQRPRAHHHHDRSRLRVAPGVPDVLTSLVRCSAFAIVSLVWNGVCDHFPGVCLFYC